MIRRFLLWLQPGCRNCGSSVKTGSMYCNPVCEWEYQ